MFDETVTLLSKMSFKFILLYILWISFIYGQDYPNIFYATCDNDTGTCNFTLSVPQSEVEDTNLKPYQDFVTNELDTVQNQTAVATTFNSTISDKSNQVNDIYTSETSAIESGNTLLDTLNGNLTQANATLNNLENEINVILQWLCDQGQCASTTSLPTESNSY